MQSNDNNNSSSGEVQDIPVSQLIEQAEESSLNSNIPTKLKVNELATLTGFNRKTVGERLNAAGLPFVEGERNSKIYVVKDALPIIYGSSGQSKDITKLDAEKLRLQTAKASLAEIELAEKEQKLISIEDIVETVSLEYTAVRNILTQLPSALATKLSIETDSRRISDIIDAEVQNALSNLKHTSEEAVKASIDYKPITTNNPETENEE